VAAGIAGDKLRITVAVMIPEKTALKNALEYMFPPFIFVQQ
jgi:hypothetical protein